MGQVHRLLHRHGARAAALQPRGLGLEIRRDKKTDTDDSDTVLTVTIVAEPTPDSGSAPSAVVGPALQQSATAPSNDGDSFSSVSAPPVVSVQSSFTAPSNSDVFQSTSTFTTSVPVTSSIIASDTSRSSTPPVTPAVTPTATPPVNSAVTQGATAPSSTPTPSTVQQGMSAGAKTGLAIGIILAVAILAAGSLFLYSRKKKELEKDVKPDNEKTPFGGAGSVMSGAYGGEKLPMSAGAETAAPTLDLRPVSRLRLSAGNALNLFNKPVPAIAGARRPVGGQTRAPGDSSWERQINPNAEKAENPFSDPVNPFNDGPAQAVAPAADPPAASAPVTNVPSTTDVAGPEVAGGAAGAAAAGAAVAAGAVVAGAVASKGPSSVTSDEPVQPSNASAKNVAVGAAGGSPPSPPAGNVHRVQLDFKPSMNDEIELRVGQLVRVLHEYDDGWVSYPKPVA